MSSDSEISGPSPLPSPIFARCSPARGTVARKCREYYLKRLERTSSMQKRWSICDFPQESLDAFGLSGKSSDNPIEVERGEVKEDDSAVGICENKNENFEGFPLRKCQSSFDLAMSSLRREISSLIAQDNDLFRQLLSLHDSIAELRERQRHSRFFEDDLDLDLEESESESQSTPTSRPPRRHSSLESLSDPPETSPESTLSSRSSHSAEFQNPRSYHKPRSRRSFCGDYDGAMSHDCDSNRVCKSSCQSRSNDLKSLTTSCNSTCRSKQLESSGLDSTSINNKVNKASCPCSCFNKSSNQNCRCYQEHETSSIISCTCSSESRSPNNTNTKSSTPYKSHASNTRSRYHRRGSKSKSDADGDSRPITFIDRSEMCFRCRKVAPPYRRSTSVSSLYYHHEDMESYDSGIHLHGSHSDSDHEIFV